MKEVRKVSIGRPSTFSNIVNTLLTRNYVKKETSDKRKDIELKKFIALRNNEVEEQNLNQNLQVKKASYL